MTQYILSPNAQKSLRNIKVYSLEKFGEEQTITYLKIIEKKLQTIVESPDIGRKREEIKKGYLSFWQDHMSFFTAKLKTTSIL